MPQGTGLRPQRRPPQREIPRPPIDIGGKSISQMLAEMGTSGTKNFAGILLDEYLPALSFYNAPTVYDQMRRSDATIAALLAAYKMPLRSSKWFIQPYDDSPDSLRMADFLHDNLWSFGSQTWDNLLPEALTFLDFGFSWFEKIFDWMPDDGEWHGMIGWNQFAFRYQSTRWRYNTKVVKGPSGASHRRMVSVTQFAPPDYAMMDLPVEKLLFFSRNKEGQNYDGMSILRPCYKHWLLCDILYRIQGIGLERESMGVPFAKWLQQADPTTIDYIRQVIENLRVDDQAGVMYDGAVVELGYLEGKFNATALAMAIDHHKAEIMKSGLAQFVNLGTRSSGTTGSYALSEDQSEMFLDALNGEANYLSSEFFLQAIIQLLTYNFPKVERRQMPRLAHGDIGQRAVSRMALALNSFAQYGFISPDQRTENVIRAFLDLPERDESVDWQTAMVPMDQDNFPDQGTLITTKNGNGQDINQRSKIAQPNGPAPVNQPQQPDQTKGIKGGPGSSRIRNIQPRPKLRNPSIGGQPTGTKMAEKDAIRVQEDFMADLESTMKFSSVPERPSERAARLRRPYEIRGN